MNTTPSSDGLAPDAERLAVDRARLGDQEALGVLYDAYLPRLYRYCLSRVGNETDAEDLAEEIFLKVLGAIAAAYTLYVIASGQPGYILEPNGLAVNGVETHSPGGYSMFAGVLIEIVMTCFFLLIIMGSTHSRAPAGFAPLAIGLGLTLIHLISIPVTNTSVNPARSTGPALIVGGLALQQLWIFWVAPIVGAVIGGGLYRWLSPEAGERPDIKGDA